MYTIKHILKHRIQIEFDNTEEIDLVARTLDKLMVWTDAAELPLDETTKFAFIAYTTKVNFIHMMNMVGVPQKYAFDDPNKVTPKEYIADFVKRLYVDRKFIKKKMHRDNYLHKFVDQSKNHFEYNFKKTFRKKFRESSQETCKRLQLGVAYNDPEKKKVKGPRIDLATQIHDTKWYVYFDSRNGKNEYKISLGRFINGHPWAKAASDKVINEKSAIKMQSALIDKYGTEFPGRTECENYLKEVYIFNYGLVYTPEEFEAFRYARKHRFDNYPRKSKVEKSEIIKL